MAGLFRALLNYSKLLSDEFYPAYKGIVHIKITPPYRFPHVCWRDASVRSVRGLHETVGKESAYSDIP